MEINQLKMFLYVAIEKNFRRAAEKLNMTQPPLTRQIQLLEHSLGTALFHRNTRRVELTEAGNVLFQEAQKIISLTENVASRVQMCARGYVGELVIGIFSWGVIHHLPGYLREYRRQKPGVNVRLKNISKERQVEALRKNEIDIGFCRFAVRQSGLAVGEIVAESYLLAINIDDDLARKPYVTLADLADKNMILYPSSSLSGMAQHVYSAFRNEGINLNVASYCEDIMTSLILVSAGYGACITTEWAEKIHMPDVIYRPLIAPALVETPLNYVFRSGDRSQTVHDFIEVINNFEHV